jgi:hypothetical protein
LPKKKKKEKRLGMGIHAYHPSCPGSMNRKNVFQDSLSENKTLSQK